MHDEWADNIVDRIGKSFVETQATGVERADAEVCQCNWDLQRHHDDTCFFQYIFCFAILLSWMLNRRIYYYIDSKSLHLCRKQDPECCFHPKMALNLVSDVVVRTLCRLQFIELIVFATCKQPGPYLFLIEHWPVIILDASKHSISKERDIHNKLNMI